MGWAAMPLGWLRSFSACLPRLRAEAQLRDLAVIQLGWGVGSQEIRERMLAALLADADVSPAAAGGVAKASIGDLAALGLRVVEE